MKHLFFLLLLLPCSSFLRGQTCIPDSYHNCGDSPLTTEHLHRDFYPLPDPVVGQWSSQTTPVPPFWIESTSGNTRLFTVDALSFADNSPDGPYFFFYESYCSFPWSPPEASAYCQGAIYWYPVSTNSITATLWIRAHFNDDGSDASHSVVLVGNGSSPTRRAAIT